MGPNNVATCCLLRMGLGPRESSFNGLMYTCRGAIEVPYFRREVYNVIEINDIHSVCAFSNESITSPEIAEMKKHVLASITGRSL